MRTKSIFRKLLSPVMGLILILTLTLTPVISPKSNSLNTAYAAPTTTTETPTTTTETTTTETPEVEQPENTENTENPETTSGDENNNSNTCYDQVGGLGWLVCPTTGLLADIIDGLYSAIESFLQISPLSTDSTSPIRLVWQYARDITNIVFIIFLLVIVWSQLTGIGISNYGIKKTLPRIIIAAILVNLSYLICTLAVDVSNITGVSIKNFLMDIAESASSTSGISISVSFADIFSGLIAGGTIAGIAIGLSGGLGHLLWMFIGVALAGVISIFVGFLTVSLRQAVVAILVMISPLAFVCYLLPNTEKWFDKWKSTLISMLIFYPMFAGLFGACQLAGWAITASAGENAFFVILGLAVRVIPLFMAASLMKMSGTVLGRVSGMFSKWTDPARRGIRKMAVDQGEMYKQRYFANSYMPAAGLRRYMDKRQRLRELNTKSNLEARMALAETGAQRIIGTGGETYDPGNPEQRIRTSVFTRDAKSAMNRTLVAQTAAMDTAHILGNYSNYHTKTKKDADLAADAGRDFLEYTRAELAATNDSYADIDWLMGKYDSFRKLKVGEYQHDHYITGAAGALGHMGDETVLGQVIGKAAANEAKRRSAMNLVYAKYGYSKGAARDMTVGYFVNDDGLATYAPDEFGNRELVKINAKGEIDQKNGRPELSPGEFLKYHPEALQAYDKYELVPDGKGGLRKRLYFDAVDQKGDIVTRVYKDDGPAMKETLANWDMPIQDPINGLYGILSGINEGDIKVNGLEGVGLARLSTTLGRAMMSSKFSEKASFAGPMYATSVSNRYIKDFVQQNIARLDNLVKTGKPSKFNTQDFAEVEQLRMLMNPENWEHMLFDEESLMSSLNVNGKFLNGTRIVFEPDGSIARDENGKIKVKAIPYAEATKEDLQNTIILKYLNPTASRMATMMTRITQQTLDSQKPGVAKSWVGLLNTLKSWRDNPAYQEMYPLLENPIAPQTDQDIIVASRELRRELIPNLPGGGPLNPTAGNPLGGPNPDGSNPAGANPTTAGAPASGQTYHRATSADIDATIARIQDAQARRADRGGIDPILTDTQRAEEAEREREIDEAWLAEQRTMGNLDPSESPNLQVRIDNAADSSFDGEQFYEAALAELESVYSETNDPQLRDIIDDFEQFHATHTGATVDEYREYLDEPLSYYSFGNL